MDPYIGEIRMFGGYFAPRGWSFCNGSLLPISQYEVLFTLIGTTYGGDGQNTFAVPDLRGRAPVSVGAAPDGINSYTLGQQAGTENVAVVAANIPSHSHQLTGVAGAADTGTPSNGVLLATTEYFQYANAAAIPTPTKVAMSPSSIGSSGASQPLTGKQPYMAINYIIALEGIFPQRQ